ncbi:MAG: metal-dependent hydrolase [Eubacteriales bacterium]|nr:metal-dependent hydrolase [Eubacteriales bacterium]
MQGKTHFFVGIAASLAICQPQNFSMLVAGTGAAAVGSVICDIDAGSSSAHHDADKIITVIIAAIASVIIVDMNFHIGIYEKILQKTEQTYLVTIALLFLVVCAFGKSTRHRTFMHSILALLVLSGMVFLVYAPMTPYFSIAFLSHILLDLLNRRKVSLFWPAKKGVCVGFCKSNGFVNGIFFAIGMTAAIMLLITSVPVRSTGNRIGQWGEQVVQMIQGFLP